MDEILASIRRIIADDQDRAPPAMASAYAAPDAVSAVPEDWPEISAEGEDAACPAPAPVPEVMREEESAMSAAEPVAAWERPTDPSPPEASGRPAFLQAALPALAGRAEAQVAEAFGRLAEAVKPPPAPTLEEHVTGMLRPMLKAWLDENLPALAERLVQTEIERISRGR